MTHAGRRSRWLRDGIAVAAIAAIAVGGLAPAAVAAGPEDIDAPGRDASVTWAGNTANPYGGVDYFIDASAGSDAAAGTSRDTAWRSLQKANDTTFQPGDRVLLKGGETWADQQLWPKGSGVDGKPIVIDAYGDESGRLPYIATNGKVTSPFSAGGVKNPDSVGLTGAVNLRNQEYVHIANLELSNDDDFATNITTGSFVRDGVSVSINADKLPAGADTVMDGIRISNLDVHNIDGPSTWQRIHYGGVNFQVFGSQNWEAYPKGGHHFRDVRIEDNTFEDVELHAVQFAFNWFGNGAGRADETGKYHENWEQLWVRDQDLYSRDVYIGHNYAESIGQGPYQFANTQRLLAEYNEANGWLQRYNQVSAGLYLWAGADSTMRYNEIYDGPANEYDATPWDLEFTNFNVTYEYNYSHDNQGGWMSYMGNSGNSIARYNLSINDNGVIWKNMLSSNYSPTYVSNNVFVYDGSKLESFHDEVLKDRVYFFNNIFYNTSTTPTNWNRKDGGLNLGVFSNNAYYEAGGVASPKQPKDGAAVIGDPKFAGDWSNYQAGAGVENLRKSAEPFQLQSSSPLIDAGRYNPRIGTADFFGNPNYRGTAPDIGIHEFDRGSVVTNPIDTDPIENEGVETRPNLALGKPTVASSTHPHQNFALKAANLVDGDKATRWAAADNATYPLTIDVDFGSATTFGEVFLDEFTDSGTAQRISAFDLQRWDPASSRWVTFTSGDGVGRDKVVTFDSVTSSKLRLSIKGIKAGEIYAPTMTEIRVFASTPAQTDPTVSPTAGLFDRNASAANSARNVVAFDVGLDGDSVRSLRYVMPSGAVVGSLDDADYTVTTTGDTEKYMLTPAFFADKELGSSSVEFDFASGAVRRVAVEIVDTTELERALADAKAFPIANTPEYQALSAETGRAQATFDAANRVVNGTGNSSTTQVAVAAAATALRTAVDGYIPAPTVIETTIDPSGLAGVDGWVRGPATVTLSSTDASASLQYRIDGGEWLAYANPVSFRTDGVHTLDSRAVAANGSVTGEGDSVTVKVDAAAPSTTVVTDPSSGTVAEGGTIRATFVAVDATAGVAGTEYSVNDGPWIAATADGVTFTDRGTFTVRYRSTDAAGNVESAKSAVLTVAPRATTATVKITSSEPASEDGWYAQNVLVSLAAPSADAGVVVQYRVNSGAWTTYRQPLTLFKDGQNVVEHRLLRSNVAVAGSGAQTIVKIDKTPPKSTITRTPGSGTGTPLNPIEVAFAGTDATSGVALVEYRLNDGTWRTPANGRIVLSEVGDWLVSYRVTDAAGNRSTVKSSTVRITPDVTPEVKASGKTVARGAAVTLTIRGLMRWTDAEISFGGQALSSVLTDQNGTAKVTVRVPTGTTPGSQTISVAGEGGIVVTTTITVK